MSRGCAGCALVAMLLIAGVASAQTNSPERVRAFAALPNWTGIWIADDGVMTELGLSGRPPGGDRQMAQMLLLNGIPYNAATAARLAAERKNAKPSTAKECGFPFPFVMESPWVFEFLVTPEETAMIVGGREIRHIYTDGRGHPKPEDVWPTPWGDSVGRWQDGTLLVDTVAVQRTRFPPALSEDAHFTERLRMVSHDKLEDEITVDDPATLAHPWTVTIPYKRVVGLDRIVHGFCNENDRNPIVDGKTTIAPAG